MHDFNDIWVDPCTEHGSNSEWIGCQLSTLGRSDKKRSWMYIYICMFGCVRLSVILFACLSVCLISSFFFPSLQSVTIYYFFLCNLLLRFTERWKSSPLPPFYAQPYKGQVHVVLTRAMVNYILYNEDAKAIYEWSLKTEYSHEIFFSTLNANAHLQAPGSNAGWWLGVPSFW